MPVSEVYNEWDPPTTWVQVDFEVEDTLSQLLKTLEKKNIQIKQPYKWVLSEKGVQYAKTDNS